MKFYCRNFLCFVFLVSCLMLAERSRSRCLMLNARYCLLSKVVNIILLKDIPTIKTNCRYIFQLFYAKIK